MFNFLNSHIDKVAHFLGGFFVVISIGILFTPMSGLILSVAIGLAKEIRDKVSKQGTPDPIDFIVTVLGSIYAYLLLY
jgi:hypothetical protein